MKDMALMIHGIVPRVQNRSVFVEICVCAFCVEIVFCLSRYILTGRTSTRTVKSPYGSDADVIAHS